MASSLALVTGAPGWLGTRLVEARTDCLPDLPELAPTADRQVRCLVVPGSDVGALMAEPGRSERAAATEVRRPELMEGDLRDRDAIRAFVSGGEGATLFHCAGVGHPARSTLSLPASSTAFNSEEIRS